MALQFGLLADKILNCAN